ncbi:TIGR01777 family oxidoreductase [Pseudomonas sp. Marseille-QA0892]
MQILLTGGTGLIGRGLCRKWLAEGHRIWVWSRSPQTVSERCGPGVTGIADLEALGEEPLDAVVNLAGAPIADRPWTESRKQTLWESRIDLTDRLVNWLEMRTQRPAVLISGSAVGWYGDAGAAVLNESSAQKSQDFATRLCAAWEASARRAEALGMRVIQVRTGLVLAHDAGLLARLVPLFKLGLGGRLGNGTQYMPWIHLEDQIALIDFLLQQPHASGPYNGCAPHPVRNRDFTRSLADALHRPAVMNAPAFALRALGEMSVLLLGGQNARPQRLEEAGFTFRFTDLDIALTDLLAKR